MDNIIVRLFILSPQWFSSPVLATIATFVTVTMEGIYSMEGTLLNFLYIKSFFNSKSIFFLYISMAILSIRLYT
jgi:hypothetical protein